MFNKYIGQFRKYEAEAVKEILDIHDGNEVEARISVLRAARGLPLSDNIHNPELFKSAVEGLMWATRGRWWFDGLLHLGLINENDELPQIDAELVN